MIVTTLLSTIACLPCASFVAGASALECSAPIAVSQADGELDEAVRDLLESRLAAGGAGPYGQLYRTCVKAHGDIRPLLDELEPLTLAGIVLNSDEERAQRLAAMRLSVGLLKQFGDLKRALSLASRSADLEPPFEFRLVHAQLLDAVGRTKDATRAYQALLESGASHFAGADGEAREAFLRLRVAMMRMQTGRGAENEGALAAYAGADERDITVRNRAAVVLGLLGRPADAIGLFIVEGQGIKRFKQEVRIAEWAIRAEDLEQAQDYAWRAAESATLRRDRHYALTILVEAYRASEKLGDLIERFAAAQSLSKEARGVWVALLRELGRVEEAVTLFSAAGEEAADGEGFSVEMRRELLEIYREAGQDEVMVGIYRKLIIDEPLELEWRTGLARYLLERGDQAGADELWRTFITSEAQGQYLLWSADSLRSLGMDELAEIGAERHLREDEKPAPALLFLFELRRDRGMLEEAEAALEQLDKILPQESAARFQLADAFERQGRLDRAARVLEGVRDSRPEGEAGEDLEMHLSWLYSELDEEEQALTSWYTLWRRVNSIPRRRYVEDRLMAVASRLGKLADIAIDLEEKLMAGEADDRDAGLLVRLYTKVKDPVSAAEIIDEHMKQSGRNEVDALQEKSRVYLACTDFYNYEKTVRQLIEVDPDGLGDYLRQLAMSQLERGRPDEAGVVLAELNEFEDSSDSAEFEAGVLALAGMRSEAIVAYRRGLANHPGRIDSYLLMADLMKQTGQVDQAIGMFQDLAENAERDDLFTVAIDGLLNMEAPKPILEWGRRIILERLAGRHDKMYLYQLLSDLSEELEDSAGMLTALENSLAISGERRSSVLRELMEISRGSGRGFSSANRWAGDEDKRLAFGRRLIGLDQVVPPQIYLDLGQSFLDDDDVASAAKTFRLARGLPDPDGFERQCADAFEKAGFVEQALRTFERVLVTNTSDVGLMVKVAELHEQLGRDGQACDLYERGTALLLQRRPFEDLKQAKEAEKSASRFVFFRSRNVDDFDKHFQRIARGLQITLPDGEAAAAHLAEQMELIARELVAVNAQLESLGAQAQEDGKQLADSGLKLARFPRLAERASHYRSLALAFDRADLADELDLELLSTFPHDADLSARLVKSRIGRGLLASARTLIEGSGRSADELRRLRFMVGDGADSGGGRRLPPDEAGRLLLPQLAQGNLAGAAAMLRRVDLGSVTQEQVGDVRTFFDAALYLGDQDLALSIGRQWLRLQYDFGMSSYQLEPIIERCRAALDRDHYRALCEYFTARILEKPEKAAGYLVILPKLQKQFEEPLVTVEQVAELLDGYGSAATWGLAPVLQLLPSAERAGALRGIWSKVENSFRAYSLLNLVSGFDEPMGEELSELVADAFEDSVDEASSMLKYYVDDLMAAKENAATALRMARAMLGQDPGNVQVQAAIVILQIELGSEKEGLALAIEILPEILKDSTDYYLRQAREKVLETLLPLSLEACLERLKQVEGDEGESAELSLKRLDLLVAAHSAAGAGSNAAGEDQDREAQMLSALESASAKHPESEKILKRLLRQHRSAGRQVEALAVLVELAELEEDEVAHMRAQITGWKALRNPVRALEVKQAMDAAGEESDESASAGGRLNSSGLPAGVSIVIGPGGSIMTSAGGGAGASAGEDAEEVSGKLKPATVKGVKKALEAERLGEAQTILRRLWRRFPRGSTPSRIFFIAGQRSSGNFANISWPEDKDKDEEATEEEQKKPSRGGLASFVEEEPEPRPEAPGAWEKLSGHDFAVDEMRRILRTSTGSQLDGMQSLCEGFLSARIASEGRAACLQSLLQAVKSGRGGKLDFVLLLALLDRHPEDITAEVRELLSDLVRTMNPADAGQVRRLARVYARVGQTQEATRLYRWCATRTQATSWFYQATGMIPPQELVKEAKENLEGDDRLAVIEAVLAFSDPGEEPWRRETYERLVFDTWEELLGPVEALERCRQLCAEVTNLESGVRRRAAARAAWLYARGGELDRALECLQLSVCRISDERLPKEILRYGAYDRPGHLSTADLRRLFPQDEQDWPSQVEWLTRAATALEGWRAEKQSNDDNSVLSMVIIARRLFALGASEEAQRITRGLFDVQGLSSGRQLYVVDIAREVGLPALADARERELFDARKLHVERIPELIGRALAQDGPAAALELGEVATAYTLHPDLLDSLVQAADTLFQQSGDAALITRWTALHDQADAAQEALDKKAEDAGGENEPASRGVIRKRR